MKKIFDLLADSNLSGFERAQILFDDALHFEETGECFLSSEDFTALSKFSRRGYHERWYYNTSVEIYNLEVSMKLAIKIMVSDLNLRIAYLERAVNFSLFNNKTNPIKGIEIDPSEVLNFLFENSKVEKDLLWQYLSEEERKVLSDKMTEDNVEFVVEDEVKYIHSSYLYYLDLGFEGIQIFKNQIDFLVEKFSLVYVLLQIDFNSPYSEILKFKEIYEKINTKFKTSLGGYLPKEIENLEMAVLCASATIYNYVEYILSEMQKELQSDVLVDLNPQVFFLTFKKVEQEFTLFDKFDDKFRKVVGNNSQTKKSGGFMGRKKGTMFGWD